jgi:hypothetical protein
MSDDDFTNRITNTAAEAAQGRISPLAALPGMIERMEALGKTEFSRSDVLPVQMGGQQALLEELGFVLGPQVPGDPLFRQAKLPSGWRKDEETGHAMWTSILDEQGCERAHVFYKAAFYDRRADMGLLWRFDMRTRDRVYGNWSVYDRKAKGFVFDPPEGTEDRYAACKAWVEEHQPHAEGVLAAWGRD